MQVTLESALAQNYPGHRELLVCTNGPDNEETVELVRDFARGHQEVRHIDVAEGGKPNAVNVLRQYAKHNVQIYTDADVLFGDGAFAIIAERLVSAGKTAVAGNPLPITSSLNFWQKMLNPPPQQEIPNAPHAICGRLYGISRQQLEHRFEKYDLTGIPKDVLCEDIWLQLLIGRDNFEMAQDAFVYFRPYRPLERMRVRRRDLSGQHQLTAQFSEIMTEYPEIISDVRYVPEQCKEGRLQGWKRKFLESETPADKAALVLGYPLRIVLDKVVDRAINHVAASQAQKGTYRWERAASTKMLAPKHG